MFNFDKHFEDLEAFTTASRNFRKEMDALAKKDEAISNGDYDVFANTTFSPAQEKDGFADMCRELGLC